MLSLSSRIYEGRLAVVFLFLALLFSAEGVWAGSEKLVVQAGRLNVRQHPRMGAKVLWRLSRGDEAEVVKRFDEWVLLRYQKRQGYSRVSGGLAVLFQEKRSTMKKRKRSIVLPTTEREAKTRLAEVRARRASEAKALKRVSHKEREVIQELDRLNASLFDARKRERALKKSLGKAEKRVAEALGARRNLEKEADRVRRDLMARLVASYKLARMGEMNTFASAGSFHEMMVKRKALTRILGGDARLLKRFEGLILEREAVEARLEKQRDLLSRAVNKHKGVLAQVEGMHKKRRQTLASIREKKILSLAAVAEMKRAEKALSLRLKTLARERRQHASKNRFISLKGLLKYPVAGRIVKSFGRQVDTRFKVSTFSNGINIRTRRGEPVQAVVAGEVLFADWVSGYGNLLIINHGSSWYTLYAHVDEMFKKKGDAVDTREVIATVGDSSLSGQPDLHFEIRHHGTPENPRPWFKR